MKKDIAEGYGKIINTLINKMGYDSKEDLSNMKESPDRAAKGFLEVIKSKQYIKKEIKCHESENNQ